MLYGGRNDDTLFGGEGDDSLWGNVGADSIVGGAGNDAIVMGGSDTVTGGEGADRITFSTTVDAGSVGVITDFDPAQDVLQVQTFDAPGTLTLRGDGADTVLVLNGADFLRLQGVAPSEIDLADITVEVLVRN